MVTVKFELFILELDLIITGLTGQNRSDDTNVTGQNRSNNEYLSGVTG